MPKDSNIKKVLVIGSGPIVIGQAAEFDYSGTQACKALKEEGIQVVLINNNPATIMTDQTFADEIYFEPLTVEYAEKIIQKEKPDGLLATVGGQTGLNLAMDLYENGILQKYGVRLLGTDIQSIKKAEDREVFRALMHKLGEPVPESEIVSSIEEAIGFADATGYPVIVRPAYTLGGFGGGIASSKEALTNLVKQGLSASPIKQCLIEKSIAGYKEIEYEVMRDENGTCITVCNMENVDPVGVHTGDSVVVAPSQTLTDDEYQALRKASLTIISALEIVGGCNIQFALHPHSSEYYLIEVNPRVSRSSALASKATGYPIAKIAAKLALGYNLHELKNPVTGTTFASFEPALDYVAVKMPRWPFDKFTDANRKLGTQMKATGEVMALERNMASAFQKAIRSLELKTEGIFLKELSAFKEEELFKLAADPDDRRFFVVLELLKRGISPNKIHEVTKISPYFLSVYSQMIQMYQELKKVNVQTIDEAQLKMAKKFGFSDQDLAKIWSVSEKEVRQKREEWQITPSYKMVDTCAAEFEAKTTYFYSSWSGESDKKPEQKKKVAVIGSGPIRIGQGVEFDYCCVHSALALNRLGYEAILINNNPETVSTDYEVSDSLYFEPLTFEDIYHVLQFEGITEVILQFGGQTSINLAEELENAGIHVLGTPADTVDQMEDRDRFYQFLDQIGIPKLDGFTAHDKEETKTFAKKLGFPVLVRPSYVIGGSGMKVFYSEKELNAFLLNEVVVYPILIDTFLEGKEAEVDVLTDGSDIFIPGIFEHIEGTGVHSGDSLTVTPPQSLTKDVQHQIISYSEKIATNMEYKGLFNIQFAVDGEKVYVIEVNPRASRTAPIMSKITDVNLVQKGTELMLGTSLNELKLEDVHNGQPFITVKAPVFSTIKLPGVTPVLSPVMSSTGEVIGTDEDFTSALVKALKGSTLQLNNLWDFKGSVFIEGDSAKAEYDSWKDLGFEVVTEKELSFDEWIKTDNKVAYIHFTDETNNFTAKMAVLERVHVFTRKETADAYLQAAILVKNTRKEVLI
ncbi:carbamoyl phosphate synthase large subunit [Fictibacillus phosphorivorans]|uniref:carbamoyl phosphate synthase large subunit n=1 Tax=Fictibacillus phosphorivorans TaxID=1221500 RepID=UPI00203BBBAD|nr:carbamoyl phosphate synthase large subunit [Fictibacillus phosphorivorans]MCM3718775.1 carbamoyl phosphate synthase large subunit [Fictibacillus phosphorivorans]MCM3776398.1 carbamoyl phosphate synthase large subunit [Fictibacillus phosphorivorans]